MRIATLTLLLGTLFACQSRDFDPPDVPEHDIREEGFLHARGHEQPFLCVDPVTGRRGACPIGRPEPENLSCDAAGCHGDNDYTEPFDTARSLHGSDGPSCYTCHEREWREVVQ